MIDLISRFYFIIIDQLTKTKNKGHLNKAAFARFTYYEGYFITSFTLLLNPSVVVISTK